MGRWRRCPRVSSTQFEFSVRLGRPSGERGLSAEPAEAISRPQPFTARPIVSPFRSPKKTGLTSGCSTSSSKAHAAHQRRQQRVSDVDARRWPRRVCAAPRRHVRFLRDDSARNGAPSGIKRGESNVDRVVDAPTCGASSTCRKTPDAKRFVARRPSDPGSIPVSSPDGRCELGGRACRLTDARIAYFSDEHSPNQFELYVAAIAKGAPRHRVAPVGAREAVWARDGSELFYRNGRQMMSARIPRGTRLPGILAHPVV